jgi:hypothetical protein
MKKSNLILFVAMMCTHLMLAFDVDWDEFDNFSEPDGPEPPPAPIDNVYFLALAVGMICFYLVMKARKKTKQC